MIDARKHHDPAKARGIAKAMVPKLMTGTELAARLDVDRRTIYNYLTGCTDPSYMAQVTLEAIYNEVK